MSKETTESPQSLNAYLNLYDEDGNIQFDKDKEDDGVFSLDNIVGRIVDPNSDVRAFFRPKDPLLHDDIMFGMYAGLIVAI